MPLPGASTYPLAYGERIMSNQQTKFTVTLADLRKNGACIGGYNKVVRAIQGKPFSDDDGERETYIRFPRKDLISIVSILASNGIEDAIWALCCIENAGRDRDIRLFAVWCARQVEHLMTDQRSKDALDVAERHANGLATDGELAAAWAAARDAVWDAASAADWDAAWDAAWAAARDAARDAASAAAWEAASAAAWDAACAAAWDAASAAAWDEAWAAARDAPRDAASAEQSKMLIDMCEGRAPWQKGV